MKIYRREDSSLYQGKKKGYTQKNIYTKKEKKKKKKHKKTQQQQTYTIIKTEKLVHR